MIRYSLTSALAWPVMKAEDRLVGAHGGPIARWIVMRRQLLYIRTGVYLGCCEGNRQF